MRIEGRLKKWNTERGFGFVIHDRDQAEFFVHVSALPPGEQPPAVGERLTFEIETDREGKKRAVRVMFPDRVSRRASPPRQAGEQNRHKTGQHLGHTFLSRFIPLAIITLLAFAYLEYSDRAAAPKPVRNEATASQFQDHTRFQCDGRKHCSQMTSCAEATYFLHNCPGTEMDGDGDGIPCESQWCS